MNTVAKQSTTLAGSVFGLDQTAAYARWREFKLNAQQRFLHDAMVEIEDPLELKSSELDAIASRISALNFAVYRLRRPHQFNQQTLKQLGHALGLGAIDSNLCAEDAISHIRVAADDSLQAGYIPYSRHALGWHTDGYYNSPQQSIHAMILHCMQPAQQGGVNSLLDHELAYILLRDQDPTHIEALSRPDVMTIPANLIHGKTIRDQQTGPVFSLRTDNRRLHLRYSARKRNIIWQGGELTVRALAALKRILDDPNHSSILRYRLDCGEGIISNNVLHNRSSFVDAVQQNQQRYYLRGRYYQSLSFSQLADNCNVLARQKTT